MLTPRHKWFRQDRTLLKTFLSLDDKLKDYSIAWHSFLFWKSWSQKQIYTTNDKFTFFVPCLFEEKRRDTVFSFPWWGVSGSKFLVGTLFPLLLPQFLSDPFET